MYVWSIDHGHCSLITDADEMQVIIELVEDGELAAARCLLRETDVMQMVRDRQSDRYVRLEQMLTRASIESRVSVVNVFKKAHCC